MKTAAFFDLDDTIIKGNSGMRSAFNYFLQGRISVFQSFNILFRYLFYFMGRSDPRRFFRNIYQFMAGMDYRKEEKRCADFFESQLRKRIYRAAKQKIEWHRKKGHVVAIVTNSLDIMIKNIVKHVKVDYLMASELEIKKGIITGKTKIVRFGENKVLAIKELAKKLNIDLKRSYAYSDNNSDIPMLSAVGNPRAVNPQRKMKRYAKQMNWKILRFTGG